MPKLTEFSITAKWVSSNDKAINVKKVFDKLKNIDDSIGITIDTEESSIDNEIIDIPKRGIGRPKKTIEKPSKPKKQKISKNAFKYHGKYYDFGDVADRTGYSRRQVRYQCEKRKHKKGGTSSYKKWAIRAMEAAKKRDNLIIGGM